MNISQIIQFSYYDFRKKTTLAHAFASTALPIAKMQHLRLYKGYISNSRVRRGHSMPKSKAIIKIENVVASATLNQKVDLNAVVKSYPEVEYRPEQFPGLVFRLKRPKTATLIFNSGKMVCTGEKKEQDVYDAVHKLHGILEEQALIFYE
jgi:TATA-box binding protein (TBP) (component of TFIID and TFIIIB)